MRVHAEHLFVDLRPFEMLGVCVERFALSVRAHFKPFLESAGNGRLCAVFNFRDMLKG